MLSRLAARGLPQQVTSQWHAIVMSCVRVTIWTLQYTGLVAIVYSRNSHTTNHDYYILREDMRRIVASLFDSHSRATLNLVTLWKLAY